MKNMALSIAVILLTASFCLVKAQPVPPSNAKHLRHLKKELKLDDNQTGKVKDILKSSQAKLKELRDRMEAAREKDMEEMSNILDDQDKQISKILNDDQKKRFEEMKDEMPEPGDGHKPPMRGMQGRPGPEGRPDMDGPQQPDDDQLFDNF